MGKNRVQKKLKENVKPNKISFIVKNMFVLL